MSKHLVQKALILLQEDTKLDKSQRNSKSSAKKYKSEQNWQEMKKSPGVGKTFIKVDRTEENIKILKKLKQLKPKPSVAEKIMEYYKQSAMDEPAEKPEVPRSILFDDDDDEDVNRKKRKKRKRDKDDS